MRKYAQGIPAYPTICRGFKWQGSRDFGPVCCCQCPADRRLSADLLYMTSPSNITESGNRTAKAAAVGTLHFLGQFEVKMWVRLNTADSDIIYLHFLNTVKQERLRNLGRMVRNCHLGQDFPAA